MHSKNNIHLKRGQLVRAAYFGTESFLFVWVGSQLKPSMLKRLHTTRISTNGGFSIPM